MRTGWIFKTESLIMPAVLDMIGGSAWLRGCLPMLNRFGQSVPPLLAAQIVRRSRYKKFGLIAAAMSMGVLFCLLAWLWNVRGALSPSLLIGSILVLYAFFFSSMGIHQLILSAMVGKLIPVTIRGRLMQFSSVLGSSVAVCCAWVLLNQWLKKGDANFAAIFLFAGVLFCVSGLIALLFRETPDLDPQPRETLRMQLGSAIRVLFRDRNFLILSITAALFGMMMTLFPHYQAVGRERLKLGFDSLVPWIIAQNLGVAIFSLPAGWLADRRGNRVVLKLLMSGLCVVPMLSLFLSKMGDWGSACYFLVFGLLGLTPVTMRTFSNYTLELVAREHQPQYLSLLSLFMAGPAMLGSLIVGSLIDYWGYEPAFMLVTAGQFIGLGCCFLLLEPRNTVE